MQIDVKLENDCYSASLAVFASFRCCFLFQNVQRFVLPNLQTAPLGSGQARAEPKQLGMRPWQGRGKRTTS